jgi:nicotinate-nucleotide adenylyltransferase
LIVAPPQGHGASGGASGEQARERRIALFGGTFDPIHIGHLAVARAAERRFHLDRYAMVALACADHPRFVPSLAESGSGHSGREIFYSVDTVRHFKQKFHGGGVRLYFLMGADSFLHIPAWKDYETLLGLCDFIVASRPGFQSDALRLVIPPELFARPGSVHAPLDPRAIALRRTTIYLLDTVSSHVSATEVRHRLDGNEPIRGLVPPRVEEYITKQALYR